MVKKTKKEVFEEPSDDERVKTPTPVEETPEEVAVEEVKPVVKKEKEEAGYDPRSKSEISRQPRKRTCNIARQPSA